ncbi:MAG: TldD/PmbA family protein [Rubricella sp.]
MTETLADLAEFTLAQARRHGAEAADVVAARSDSLSVDIREGKLDRAERSESTDLGLRVLVGKRQATVSSSDTRPETLSRMAERAVAMARLAPEDPFVGLADPDQLSARRDAAGLDLDDGVEPSADALEQAALALEEATRSVDGVTQVDASAGFGRTEIILAATNGFLGGYTRSGHSLSSMAISGEGLGMERDYDYDSRIHHADLRDPVEIGRSAGERAVRRSGPRKPRTGAYPVLFDERIASGLIGHLLQAVNGAAVARGSSWAKNLLGEAILAADFDLVEEPLRARTSGSRPFDGEGLSVGDRRIVEGGRLTGWTLDLATARKLGLESTGNATRGGAGAPSPGITNVRLVAPARPLADLIADMGTGLLVTSLIGSTINPNTGDYSRGASGFWIENGEIAYPVNECTIAGNLIEMLRSLQAADDARGHLSRVVPSLLVEKLTLAGS